jgi:hypothetical protein
MTTGTKMIPFVYGSFYDVPRTIVLRYNGRVLLLHSAFDEEADEYEPNYSVYALPESAEAALAEGSWKFMEEPGLSRMGEIAVQAVRFDSGRRKLMDAQVLDELIIA